jgi:hypothetical protein
LFTNSTPGAYTTTVPDGIETIHVVAVGAPGVGTTTAAGGAAAGVEADLAVEAGNLYVNVGGGGFGTDGGFNGGGDGAPVTPGTNLGGGGGGGATDIRTVPGALDSRILVAAGGGGAGRGGGTCNMAPGGAGGTGGAAGNEGGDGGGATAVSRGGGGGAGTQSNGGIAGPAGTNASEPSQNGTAGQPGQLGVGGSGGPSVTNSPPGEGGGGGGGLYGGGGGGGASIGTGACPQAAGGGGGGGGSSLVPPGGTIAAPTPAPDGAITISYTTPGTAITSAPPRKVTTRKRRKQVKIAFAGDGAASLVCSFDGGTGAPCTSPVKRNFKLGRHTVEVTGVAANGNHDLTPASTTFRVVRKRRR